MTSYSVIAPIILARFRIDTDISYQAWSPQRYGSIYQYDIIIEGEDNQHPMMNIEYIDFLHRVTYLLANTETEDTDQTDQTDQTEEDRQFLDMTTDFHSATQLNERGDTCYCVMMNDTVFSPIFFLWTDVELYLRFLMNEFVVLRTQFRILEIPHQSI